MVVEGLNEGLKTLLSAIKENPGIKAKDLSIFLNGRPVKTLDKDILKAHGDRKGRKYSFQDLGHLWDIWDIWCMWIV